jgi:ssRNA-specific RNase YbeY (16S rRNA maturation enzyme)
LHLLGYDHVDEAERMKMWARQNEILESKVTVNA